MTTAAEVARVLDEHPALSWAGYGVPDGDVISVRGDLAGPESTAEIGRAAAWAREHLEQRKTVNPQQTSYGLKHLAEDEIGYVTNGQMIIALLLAGFRMRPVPRGINPAFNVTERSARALRVRRWNSPAGRAS